jgi:class 3 adenylate cyclase
MASTDEGRSQTQSAPGWSVDESNRNSEASCGPRDPLATKEDPLPEGMSTHAPPEMHSHSGGLEAVSEGISSQPSPAEPKRPAATRPPVVSSFFQFELDPEFQWGDINVDTLNLNPLQPISTNAAVVENYRRLVGSLTLGLPTIVPFVVLALFSLGSFFAPIEPAVGIVYNVASTIWILSAIAELLVWRCTASTAVADQTIKCRRHEWIVLIGWALPLILSRVVESVYEFHCPSYNPRNGVDEDLACSRSFRSAYALDLTLVALFVSRPERASSILLLLLAADVVHPIVHPHDAQNFAYRIALSVMYVVILAFMNIRRERGFRTDFSKLVVLAGAQHKVDNQRNELQAAIRAAIPARLLHRLAQVDRHRSPQSLADSSNSAVVCVTETVSFTHLATTTLLKETVETLHELFTYFDTAVAAFGLDQATTYGDRYVVTAGLIQGSRSSVVEMCRFALWQVTAVSAKLHEPLPLHSAIAAGELRGGLAGSSTLRYVLDGAALASALHVLATVPAGRVFVSHSAVALDPVGIQEGNLPMQAVPMSALPPGVPSSSAMTDDQPNRASSSCISTPRLNASHFMADISSDHDSSVGTPMHAPAHPSRSVASWYAIRVSSRTASNTTVLRESYPTTPLRHGNNSSTRAPTAGNSSGDPPVNRSWRHSTDVTRPQRSPRTTTVVMMSPVEDDSAAVPLAAAQEDDDESPPTAPDVLPIFPSRFRDDPSADAARGDSRGMPSGPPLSFGAIPSSDRGDDTGGDGRSSSGNLDSVLDLKNVHGEELQKVVDPLPPCELDWLSTRFVDPADEERFLSLELPEATSRLCACFGSAAALLMSVLLVAGIERGADPSVAYPSTVYMDVLAFGGIVIAACGALTAAWHYRPSHFDNSAQPKAVDDGDSAERRGSRTASIVETPQPETGEASRKSLFIACVVWFAVLVPLQLALFVLQRSVVSYSPQYLVYPLLALGCRVYAVTLHPAAATALSLVFVTVPLSVCSIFHLGVTSVGQFAIFLAYVFLTVYTCYTAGLTTRRVRFDFIHAQRALAKIRTNARLLERVLSRLLPRYVAADAIGVLNADLASRDKCGWRHLTTRKRLDLLASRHLEVGLDHFLSNFVAMEVSLRLSPATTLQKKAPLSDAEANVGGAPVTAAAALLQRWEAIGRLIEEAAGDCLHHVQALGDRFTVGGPFSESDRNERIAAVGCVRLLAQLARVLDPTTDSFTAAAVVEEAFAAIVGECSLRYRCFGVAPLHSSALLDAGLAAQRYAPRPTSMAFFSRRFALSVGPYIETSAVREVINAPYQQLPGHAVGLHPILAENRSAWNPNTNDGCSQPVEWFPPETRQLRPTVIRWLRPRPPQRWRLASVGAREVYPLIIGEPRM